ncbi:hypothetical protein OZ411_35905 [Bradyrhizobium sp. Arg237L]|uniref:hypothetical protein n=1 Tax=Bradyrhizobium sp. Arg237L TaxID=3003352 RepID=UPI00249DF67F|nr:hypothetical protein [Bradyrhizobium sp. Arg237L]MDI4238199.1 hypothetical protein [Bradyrhizobium sp. Arg237L]
MKPLDRRVVLGGLAVGWLTSGSGYWEEASKRPVPIGQLRNERIPSSVTRIECLGDGPDPVNLIFESDASVDSTFLAEYPSAAFAASDGRNFRLSADTVFVEAFGAIGDGLANDQPAIQQAIRYAETFGAGTVRFRRHAYAVWCPKRTSDPRQNNAYDGHSIIIERQIALVGEKNKSRILFRNHDGGELQSNWQTVNGKVWRGPGIFLKGRPSPASDRSNLPSVTLVDIELDGGCDRTNTYNFPADVSSGDGWDLTHKGLWAENDRATGDWTLMRSKVVRFRGEVFYQGGSHHGSFTGRDIVMGQTNADILNPCGTNLDIERGYFFDGNQGWEGWGGAHGRLKDCTFESCRRLGGLQGGRAKPSKVRGGWNEPTRFSPGEIPWVDLDIRIIDCGPVYIGSWIRGQIDMTDSFLALSTKVYPKISDVILSISARCRRKSMPCVVSITAGEGVPNLIKDIKIRVKLEQPASQFRFAQLVSQYGNLDDASNVSVKLES